MILTTLPTVLLTFFRGLPGTFQSSHTKSLVIKPKIFTPKRMLDSVNLCKSHHSNMAWILTSYQFLIFDPRIPLPISWGVAEATPVGGGDVADTLGDLICPAVETCGTAESMCVCAYIYNIYIDIDIDIV